MFEEPKQDKLLGDSVKTEAFQENTQEKIKTAENTLRNFMAVKPGEKILFLCDANTKTDVVEVMKAAAINIGCPSSEFIVDKNTKSKTIDELLEQHQVIVNLVSGEFRATNDIFEKVEESREEEGETQEAGVKKRNNRMVALFDTDSSLFDPDGAMSEDPIAMRERLNRMEARLKDAVGFHITSSYGTDLTVPLMSGGRQRRWFKDGGLIDQPGAWNNLPPGEIFTTPDQYKVNGTLVLPVVESNMANHQGVDEFIHLTIRDGYIVAIQGGQSAETMRQELMKNVRKEKRYKEKDPTNIVQIAEIAFGANSKARSTATDPDAPYDAPAVTVVEAEKRFGTMHLAFGDSMHGEEGADGFTTNNIASHFDFVLPRNGLTVEMFTSEADMKSGKNGEKVINEGGINFF